MLGSNRFFDTNVLAYLLSADEARAARARVLVEAGGVTSVQVLNELVNVGRKKMGLSWPELRRWLADFESLLVVVPMNVDVHDQALDVSERYGFSIYDSLIVSAALLAGCSELCTEDLQHGQVIDGLVVQNAFR